MSTVETEIEFAPSAHDKNLDMVRNILFGEQTRENDRRLATLERFVRVWTTSVRDEMRRNFENLHHEINLVNDLLTEESKARLSDTAIARKNHDQATKSIENIYKQIQATQSGFNQRLDEEVAHLTNNMAQQREELLTQLKQSSEQLRQDKVDRKMLATLLENVTRQLTGDTL